MINDAFSFNTNTRPGQLASPTYQRQYRDDGQFNYLILLQPLRIGEDVLAVALPRSYEAECARSINGSKR